MVSTPVDLIFSSVSCWAATGPPRASPTASTRTTATVFFMGPPSMGEDLRQELLAALRFRRGEEVLGRRLLDHLSLVHEYDAVGDAAGEPHFVRDTHHRHAVPGERGHDVEHLVDHLRVERGGRLVEQHDL